MEKNNLELESLFADRKRTNILWFAEQKLIIFFLRIIPSSFTPNLLTAVGMLGSLIIFSSFILADAYHSAYLLIGVPGLFVNWLGDSLDGRLAYFRKIERKWYGFALDIIMDWLSIILVGLGYYFYAGQPYKILGFLFVVFYGWSMIIALLRYKITGVYKIDSGSFGPTELRIIIALMLTLEVIYNGAIDYLALAVTVILFIVNIFETRKTLNTANLRDEAEHN